MKFCIVCCILFLAMLAAICFGVAGVLNIMTEVNYGKQVRE